MSSTVICLMLATTALIYIEVEGGSTNKNECAQCGAQPGCVNVTTVPVKLSKIACQSPVFEPASTQNELYAITDSVCNTLFYSGDNTYILFRGVSLSNGSYIIQKYVIADNKGYPGSYRIQGLFTDDGCASFVDQQCVLGEACSGTYVVYRCTYFAGDLGYTLPNVDIRYVISPNKTLSSCCFESAVAIATSQQFNSNQFAQAPNRLPAKCVAFFNGAPCINYERIAKCDRVSIP